MVKTYRPWRAVSKAVLYASAASVLFCGVLRFLPLSGAERVSAFTGIIFGLGSTAASATAMAFVLGSSWAMFWGAFGGGMFLRLSVMAGLMTYSWNNPRVAAPALLAAYGLTVAGLLVIEFNQLASERIG